MSSLSSIKKGLKTPGAPKLTNAKQRQGALTALEQLQQVVGMRLIPQHNQMRKQVTDLGHNVEALNATVAALIELAGGVEKVQEVVKRQRKEALEAEAQQLAAAVAKGVEEGTLVAADVADDECLVVLEDKLPDGRPSVPSRVHTQLPELKETLREALRGQAVGFNAKVDGFDSTIVGLYKHVAPKLPELPADEEAPPEGNSADPAPAEAASQEVSQ